MKSLLLIVFISLTHFSIAQTKETLPKIIAKNWVYIPKLDFETTGIIGNDTINFDSRDRHIQTDAFFISSLEISNKAYHQFINEFGKAGMLPDTNSWVTDFKVSYNGPMLTHYFSHPKYDDYPVVGVSQTQALAYCQWLQDGFNKQLKESSKYKNYECSVTLPTQTQWESAYYHSYQEGNINAKSSGWFLRHNLIDKKGSYKVNYGQEYTPEGFVTKDYISDGGLYPLDVYSYGPNRKGIYNLLGNIAEWTISPAYNTSDVIKFSLDTIHKTITYYTKQSNKEKYDTSKPIFYWGSMKNIKRIYQKDGYMAVKGGSWRHGIFHLQPAVSLYCKPLEQHSFVGFRPVLTIHKRN